MNLTLTWADIALRLGCAIVAGGLLGWNRSEKGRAAGLRTTVLVTMASCVALLMVNALIELRGKQPDSFIQLDLMRLPLGILTGMGFIGGGAIVKKDNLVVGVTTAATLWFATVIGFCFGSGLLGLGWSAGLTAFLVLIVFRHLEDRIAKEHLATLAVISSGPGPSPLAIRDRLVAAGLKVDSCSVQLAAEGEEVKWSVGWKAREVDEVKPPDVVYEITRLPGVTKVAWEPQPR